MAALVYEPRFGGPTTIARGRVRPFPGGGWR
jgi:hypothetical protein